jgi:hypothetical protein
MFKNSDELRVYVIENYPDVTDARIDDAHWDFERTNCKVTRGFQLTKRIHGMDNTSYNHVYQDTFAPTTYVFRCPVCHAFKQWTLRREERSHPDRKSWNSNAKD